MRALICLAVIFLCSVARGEHDKTIGPSESRFGKEPYYFQSENSAWYDSYGRLRYGPRGIPADEYRARKRAEQERIKRKLDKDLGTAAPKAGTLTR